MKKLCSILIIIALTTTISFAQTFGVNAGVNLANLTHGSDMQDLQDAAEATSNMIIGISVGATGTFELSDVLDLNAGISYIQKGMTLSLDYTGDGEDEDISTKLNFIDIAPSLSYKITNELSASIGTYVGFALSGTQDDLEFEYDMTTGEIITTITSEAIDFEEDEVGTLDYGLNIGVSYVLNEMIAINAGYCLGLADLNAEGGEFDGQDYSKKTNGIYFSVGYLFGGGY
jgi:long-subunit fatty acid transport protein